MKRLSLYRAARLSVCACSATFLLFAMEARAGFTDQAGTILPGVNHNSRSASFGDMDDDGDLDLYFQGASGSQKLYRNNLIGTGTMTYTDVSASMLPGGLTSSWSAAWADYNGDGNTDIFIGQTNFSGAVGRVLRNNGVAGFSDESAAIGLDDPGFHQNVAWADIDSDNDLDLIIAMEGPEKHEIYAQQSNGTFTSVAGAAGFQIPFDGVNHGKAYGMAIGDSDGDGDLDIYISTCIAGGNIRNNFFENQLAQTGSLTFVDIADTNGTQYFDNSYGAEFVDFDDDSDLDLFVVGADNQDSKIYRNDGGNQFTDVDTINGQPLLSTNSGDLNGGRVVDYDNDGDLDLFMHDHKPLGGNNNARKLFRNDGNWQFTDVTVAQGLHEVNHGSYDSPWGDIDRDGDQDLIGTTDSGANERVFLNDASTNGNHWLYVELEGPDHNTTGLGTAVFATINEGTPQERTIRREANTNAGTFNQSDLPVHFGLGDATLIDNLRIVWDNGWVQQLFDVDVDQYITVDIGDLLDGDIDGDGFVGLNDLDVILGNWNQNVPVGDRSSGDLAGIGDGFIGLSDLDVVLNNWNAGTLPPTVSVPEPAALAPFILIATRLFTRRPRSRQ